MCVLVCMVQHVCGCGGIDVCDVVCIPMVWYVCGPGLCVCVCMGCCGMFVCAYVFGVGCVVWDVYVGCVYIAYCVCMMWYMYDVVCVCSVCVICVYGVVCVWVYVGVCGVVCYVCVYVCICMGCVSVWHDICVWVGLCMMCVCLCMMYMCGRDAGICVYM